MNTLHIYSPLYPHDDGFIIGDEESLEKLRLAIDHVLRAPTGRKDFSIAVFANDGEGYHLRVQCVDPFAMAKLPIHYAATDNTIDAGMPPFLSLPNPPTKASGKDPDVKPWDDPLL